MKFVNTDVSRMFTSEVGEIEANKDTSMHVIDPGLILVTTWCPSNHLV